MSPNPILNTKRIVVEVRFAVDVPLIHIQEDGSISEELLLSLPRVGASIVTDYTPEEEI